MHVESFVVNNKELPFVAESEGGVNWRLSYIWGWLCPFGSHPQVGSLKEPKPVFV